MLYSHVPCHNNRIIKMHAGITDAMIKTQEDFFIKIFTSHFIGRVRKGLLMETEDNWNILTPKLWPSALCLSRSPGLLNRSPRVHSAGCWLPLLPLVYLPLQLYSTVFLLFNSSAIYYLQTPTQWYGHASTSPQYLPISGDRDVSLLLSLEWPVWLSSSGNNCHAVQRSLPSSASVYESIMGLFFTSSHFISQFPPTRFPLLTAIRMCHFLPVHHLEWHFWPGQKIKTSQLKSDPYTPDFLNWKMIIICRLVSYKRIVVEIYST